ncbi:MAG TPA: MarR family winged helix-turn-helix transcriptional regulator [Chthoniobacteraceae bacterium]|jgi:DNA-binding MarR family transcriptional regulator|nr:MarR family winged helix-turn-helix transcriptional regulator [Chthoniobacteraceae bacterium]
MGIQVQANEPKTPLGATGDVRAELQRLEAGVERLRQMMAPAVPTIAPQVTPTRIRQVIKARRAREMVLGSELFADPAWDMLLEAYNADLMQTKLSVTALCHSAAVPATTALRWLRKLEQNGWLSRKNDPLDARRTWMVLTPWGSTRMSQYFSTVRPDVLPI